MLIVLCKSVVSEGKELISNWPIRFQETHGFSFLIGQFDINSFPSLTMDLQSTITIQIASNIIQWHSDSACVQYSCIQNGTCTY